MRKYVIEGGPGRLRFLCQANGVQWWGSELRFAKRFTSRSKAQFVATALVLSTDWAQRAGLKVREVVTGEVLA